MRHRGSALLLRHRSRGHWWSEKLAATPRGLDLARISPNPLLCRAAPTLPLHACAATPPRHAHAAATPCHTAPSQHARAAALRTPAPPLHSEAGEGLRRRKGRGEGGC